MRVNRYLEQARKMLRGAGSAVVATALVGALMLGGCTSANAASSATATQDTASASVASGQSSATAQQAALSTDWYDPAETSIDISGMDFEYGNRESSGEWDAEGATTVTFGDVATVEGEGATADGSTVTITAAGTYVVSGASANGQIVVDAGDEDKVQIVLNGASITNASGPALLVGNADKVFVTVAEGTENTLSDTAENTATLEDESLNAAVYAKDDICFNGTGTLTVNGNSAHAIKGKDDVVITGGTYHITAVQDGIRGKDSVKATGADIDITAGSDGIQTSEADDAGKGFISIDGGTLTVNAGDDGIQASRYLRITGGTLNITAADDALHSDIDGLISGGTITLNAGDDAFHTEFNLGVSGGTVNVEQSYEGLEGQRIVLADGTVNVNATDDALNAAQGFEEQDTGSDSEASSVQSADAATQGQPSDATAQGQAGGGQQVDPSAGDMMEGQAPEDADGQSQGMPQPPQGGQAPEDGQAPDDADGQAPQPPQGGQPNTQAPENADGEAAAQQGNRGPQGRMPQGEDAQGMQGGFRGGMGGGMMDDDGVSLLVIEGGTLTVSANGDGLDSNGDLLMTGGTVYVSGPENDGNGSLDYGGDAVITGGTILAAGSSGMAETFGSESTQASILVQASGQAGDTVSVVDESGIEIVSFQAAKRFACVIASAPGMSEGATYKVLVNGTEAASGQATTQQAATGFGGGMPGMGDRGDAMGGTRGQHGMGPGMNGGMGGQRA